MRKPSFHPKDLGPSYLLIADGVAREPDGSGGLRAYSLGDQSGTGKGDCIGASAAERPAWLRVDGIPTLRFDGVNDRLQLANVAGLPSGGQACTALLVLASTSPTTLTTQFPLFWYTFPDGLGVNLTGIGMDLIMRAYVGGYSATPTPLPSTPNFALIGFDYDGSDVLRTYVNGTRLTFTGVVDGSGAGSVDEVSVGGYAGGGLPFKGDLRLVVIFSRVLTDAELALLQEWAEMNLGVV